MSWTEYLRKHKHTNKSEDDIYLDYYNKYLCNEDFENEILNEIEYEAKLDNLEDNKARQINKYHKQYYLNNIEKKKLYNKEYYLENKENLQKKRRQYYLENKNEIRKKYCLKNKEYAKQYYLENKENLQKKRRQYYFNNKEKIKKRKRQLYLKKKLKTASFNLGKKIIG